MNEKFDKNKDMQSALEHGHQAMLEKLSGAIEGLQANQSNPDAIDRETFVFHYTNEITGRIKLLKEKVTGIAGSIDVDVEESIKEIYVLTLNKQFVESYIDDFIDELAIDADAKQSGKYKKIVDFLTINKADEALDYIETLADRSDEEFLPFQLLKATIFTIKLELDQAEMLFEELIESSADLKAIYAYTKYLMLRSEYLKAKPFLETALEICDNSDTPDEPMLANILSNLASINMAEGENATAEIHYFKALRIFEQLSAELPMLFDPKIASTMNNLATALKKLERFEEAEDNYMGAIAIYSQLVNSLPRRFKPKMAATLNNLGNLERDRAEFEQAEDRYKQAIELYSNLAAENPMLYEYDLSGMFNNLAYSYLKKGDVKKSDESYEQALEIRERLAKNFPERYELDLLRTLMSYGMLKLHTKDLQTGVALVFRAKDLAEKNKHTDVGKRALETLNMFMDQIADMNKKEE